MNLAIENINEMEHCLDCLSRGGLHQLYYKCKKKFIDELSRQLLETKNMVEFQQKLHEMMPLLCKLYHFTGWYV